jgi:Fe-S cluster assembly scaffold protein SufB
VEHEASTSKIGEDQLFYFQQRGVDHEKAVAAIPYEFAQEVDALMNLKLEGSVG